MAALSLCCVLALVLLPHPTQASTYEVEGAFEWGGGEGGGGGLRDGRWASDNAECKQGSVWGENCCPMTNTSAVVVWRREKEEE